MPALFTKAILDKVSELNQDDLNQAALSRLNEAEADAPPHYLHLLSLAAWGLDEGVEGEWPEDRTYVLQNQVNLLFGWNPENFLTWLFNNPNAPDDPEEQRGDLLGWVEFADTPQLAAAYVLNAIYSRMTA